MEKIDRIISFSGLMFMFITSIMFYNHLFTAFRNPGFFTVVYFDYFGEGMFEIIVFSIFIPFIGYTMFKEVKENLEAKK
jgi:hypothetical protein